MRLLCAAFAVLALTGPAAAQAPAPIPVGRGPCCLAVSGGSIWVGNQRDSSVQQIDPASNSVRATVQAGPRSNDVRVSGLIDMVAAYGDVWVTNGGTHRIYRIDAQTRAVRALSIGRYVGGVAASAGKIWVSIDHTGLARVDPRRLRVERRVQLIDRINGFITSIAAGRTAVWVATDGGDVLKVDAATLRVRAQLRLGRSLATSVGVLSGDSYWVVRAGLPTLFRIRTAGATIAARRAIGVHAAHSFPSLAAAGGSLWLLQTPATVVELEPATGTERQTLRVPLQDPDESNYVPGAVAVGLGSTWVTSWPGTRGFTDPTLGVVYRFPR
jgi:YVTN family beta-propeller protein